MRIGHIGNSYYFLACFRNSFYVAPPGIQISENSGLHLKMVSRENCNRIFLDEKWTKKCDF